MLRIVADPKPARLPRCVVDAFFGDLNMTRKLTHINIARCRLRREGTPLTHAQGSANYADKVASNWLNTAHRHVTPPGFGLRR